MRRIRWAMCGSLVALSWAGQITARARVTQTPPTSQKNKAPVQKTVIRKPVKSAKPVKPAGETPATAAKRLAEEATKSRAQLINATTTLRASLAKLLDLQTQELARAKALVERQSRLLEMGVLARREVEASQQAVSETEKKIAETNQQLDTVDQLVAEVTATEEFAKQALAEMLEPDAPSTRSGVLLVRYIGRNLWALPMDFPKVDEYFRQKFGRPLPISAFGQTATHNSLGFDHSNALDVAVHPDSAEGIALQAWLRAQGISFIAIRGAIPGSATGAHIHIGLPSKRVGAAF